MAKRYGRLPSDLLRMGPAELGFNMAVAYFAVASTEAPRAKNQPEAEAPMDPEEFFKKFGGDGWNGGQVKFQ